MNANDVINHKNSEESNFQKKKKMSYDSQEQREYLYTSGQPLPLNDLELELEQYEQECMVNVMNFTIQILFCFKKKFIFL